MQPRTFVLGVGRIVCSLGMLVVLGAPDAQAGGTACATAADCTDGDVCTADACTLIENAVPPPNCKGKVTAITFKYTGLGCSATTNVQGGKVTCTGGTAGAAPVRVVVRDKKYASIVYGETAAVALGGRARGTAAAANLNEFKADSRVQILDGAGAVIEDVVFHTSCSQPLNLGDRFGSLEVVSLTTTNGGVQGETGTCGSTPIAGCTPCTATADCSDANVCTTDSCEVMQTPPPPPHCTGKVTAIRLRYTGLGCSATTNPQGGKATCTGGAAGATPVRMRLRDPSNAALVYGDTAGVALGGTASGTAATANLSEFKSNTRAEILNGVGTVLEDVVFHTSCSQPLNVGDRFGSLEVVSLTTTVGDTKEIAGVCRHVGCADCDACSSAADCNDGNGCTIDTCDGGACGHAEVPGCVPCTAASQCADANPCTTDICAASGVCEHQEVAGCILCTTAADCDDQDPCTDDRCGPDGSCAVSAIPGCIRCTCSDECDDGNACTENRCVDGVCANLPIPDCGVCHPAPEACGDGIDNDCDALVDCNDPNCTETPACAPPVEICGDCVDNDGDGLVDYEDADCCAQPLTLALRKVTLRPPGVRVRKDRVRIRSVFAPVVPFGFDPLTQETSLQVADDEGQIFCVAIPAEHWMRRGKRTVTFWDREGRYADGLSDGRFVFKRNGSVVFRTHGRRASVRQTDGRQIRITVRVGEVCSQTTAGLRPTKTGLVFP